MDEVWKTEKLSWQPNHYLGTPLMWWKEYQEENLLHKKAILRAICIFLPRMKGNGKWKVELKHIPVHV